MSAPAANLQSEKPAADEYFRPGEDDRLERAKKWLRIARGLPQDLLPFEVNQ
jgi:hypothetical protein